MHKKYVLYATVLPVYRTRCVKLLKDDLGDDLAMYASPEHLDRTVKTGVPEDTFTETRLTRLGRHLYIQFGGWVTSMRAKSLIVDFNPRSITAWGLLIGRRMLRRRTLIWGHVHSRAGATSKSARLRRLMRTCADGMVTYTPSQGQAATAAMPDQPVWVASNALYTRSELSERVPIRPRSDVLYVGRLEPEKRVALLAEAFAIHAQKNPSSRLVLVGAGSLEGLLREKSRDLGIDARTNFRGWVNDLDQLRTIYSTAFCSVSPGFAGLGLTQSLGFGVPQLVADDQVHSPEIELADIQAAVQWFPGSSPAALADAISDAYERREQVPYPHLKAEVSEHFSAESMADGLADAFRGRSAINA